MLENHICLDKGPDSPSTGLIQDLQIVFHCRSWFKNTYYLLKQRKKGLPHSKAIIFLDSYNTTNFTAVMKSVMKKYCLTPSIVTENPVERPSKFLPIPFIIFKNVILISREAFSYAMRIDSKITVLAVCDLFPCSVLKNFTRQTRLTVPPHPPLLFPQVLNVESCQGLGTEPVRI